MAVPWAALGIPSGLDLPGLGLSAADLAAITAIRNNPANQLSNLSFSARMKDNAFSGLATLSYKVTSDVLLYATYSRGSKSGGLNVTAGGASRPVVDPEKVDAYEVGLKSQWLDGRLTVNTAAFLTDIRNYQTTVSEAIPGSTVYNQYLTNIPQVRSKGIEADLSFSPTKWITLSASGAYTDARFIRFTNSPQRPELAIPGTPQVQDLSGQRLPGISKFAYALAAEVTQPLSETLETYARGDWLHRSAFNVAPTNSVYGAVPAYGVLNGRIGLRVPDKQIDLSVWARNLLDKKYYVNRSGGNFGLITALPGDPRTIGATLRVAW